MEINNKKGFYTSEEHKYTTILETWNSDYRLSKLRDFIFFLIQIYLKISVVCWCSRTPFFAEAVEVRGGGKEPFGN